VTRPPELKNGIPCDALTDWPHGSELCGEPALFEVERAAQVGMTVCAEHLGPILRYAKDVVWPPCVLWLGPGHRPRNALARGGPEIEECERKIFGS
jgi:hypothetical protein